MSYVFILRVGDASFSEVAFVSPLETVRALAARACAALAWDTSAPQVALFLVSREGARAAEADARAASAVVRGTSLFSGDALGDVGVGAGSWLVARVLNPARTAPAVSPRENFRALLVGAGVDVDERVMSTIARSSTLSSRATMAATGDEALALYSDASAVPRTETRASVHRSHGVIIDGDMAVPGASVALFFHAFEKGYVPRVLKVPALAGAAMRECALWRAVSEHALAAGVALVPVERLELGRGAVLEVHTTPGRSDISPLREGILMPAYAGTLARVPPPADSTYVALVVTRIEAALRFLHVHGWLHGDVKPSNIFIDFAGGVWLGDYGSSAQHDAVARDFGGGTTAFQSNVADAVCDPLQFDLTGLAVSALVLLGLLRIDAVPSSGWPLAALTAAVARVDDGALRVHLAQLLGGSE